MEPRLYGVSRKVNRPPSEITENFSALAC